MSSHPVFSHAVWQEFLLASSRVVLAVLIATGFASTALAQQQTPTVTVSKPLAKTITRWDEFSGRFEAVSNVEVRPRVSGFIDEVKFEDGALVKKGDILYEIDKRPFKIAVESARAEIARADANVKLQQNEVERAEPLVAKRIVSDRDFEQRRANLAIAQAQRQSAQAVLRQAELDLQWTEVRAPISGRVSDTEVDTGALVTGGSQNTSLLTTIVTLDPIHFTFTGSETDYLRYVRMANSGGRESSRETGNPVRIRLTDEETWLHEGRMDFVDNRMNPRSGTIRARAVVPNADGVLIPGVFGRMQLFGGKVDALLVPDQAVVSDQTEKIVFTIGPDNTIVPKQVKLGKLYEGLRIIQSGLEKTDRVVINGIANPAVRPGAAVNPQDGEIAVAGIEAGQAASDANAAQAAPAAPVEGTTDPATETKK